MKRTTIFVACLLAAMSAWAKLSYDAASFGIVPGTTKDMSALVVKMLDQVKSEAAGKPGYHIFLEVVRYL